MRFSRCKNGHNSAVSRCPYGPNREHSRTVAAPAIVRSESALHCHWFRLGRPVRITTCKPRDLPTAILRASQHRAGCTDAANVPSHERVRHARGAARDRTGHALNEPLTTVRGLAHALTDASSQASRPSACPGLMRIVPARDGGLCRIRLNGGEMSAAQARVVADVAMTCGSGFIDATNRSNLQIRGVRPDAEDALILRLVEAGLGPTTPDADDVRNLMLSPFAGLDPNAILDVTPIARVLLEQMQRDPRLRELSPKFAILLDGGERLAMLDHPHDVWFSAVSVDRF